MDEVIFLPPVYGSSSRFYPASREWHVSMPVFLHLQDICRVEPRWVETNIMPYTGPGGIKVIVVVA